MRKQIFTLILSVMAFGLVSAQTVILDPATLDVDSLPAGMEVVEMDGVSYLQVVMDGWNSTIDIPEIADIAGTTFSADVKFAQASTTIGLSDLTVSVQLMDTVNTVPPSWDPNSLVPVATSLLQDPPTGEMVSLSQDVTEGMEFVHQIQFFCQEHINWGPTVGDTIWVGAITSDGGTSVIDRTATLSVYPNPTNELINVVEDITAYDIYNMTGAVVLSSSTLENKAINVSTLPNGVYVIRTVDLTGKIAIAKFNKQ